MMRKQPQSRREVYVAKAASEDINGPIAEKKEISQAQGEVGSGVPQGGNTKQVFLLEQFLLGNLPK